MSCCCVRLDDEVVGHLKRGKSGHFAKTIFYFLRADPRSSCSVIIKGKAVNLGDGEGMQVPCKLRLSGAGKFVKFYKRNWITLNSDDGLHQLWRTAL